MGFPVWLTLTPFFFIMQEKISGIVIDIVRHNDRHNIVTLFTRSRGRIAFLSPVGKGKSGAMRAARIAPLAWLDSDINFRASRSLQVLSNVGLHRVWRNLYFDPVRSSLILFLAEFLNKLLRVCAPDPEAFDYIADSLTRLDVADTGISNFHIAFLIGMLRYSGIPPLVDDYCPGKWLDMRAGSLCVDCPVHPDYLTPADTARFISLLDMDMENAAGFPLSGADRSEILQMVLRYYSVHLPGILPLKTAAVLREIFS